MKSFCVYIMASKKNGTLYIGVTSDLVKRIYEHKLDLIDGFTKKYAVHLLVYYETIESAEIAISREKQLKAWKRDWKIQLIEKENPKWEDLYIRSQNTPLSGDECESEYILSRAEISARSCKLKVNTEGFQPSEVYETLI